jgi:23S rRNA G2445 N2-methylase RlmL
LILPAAADLEGVLSLRTVEDIFVVTAVVGELSPGRRGLEEIERAVAAPERLLPVVAWAHRVPKRIQRRRIGYRLVGRDDGSADFTRHAVVRHVNRALGKLQKPRWEEGGEGAPVELWLIVHRGAFYCLLRVTDRSFRHREYKAKHIPGSLRPTLASALVLAGEPKPGDRFVDPLCGAGTVAIERALWGPARAVIGGDREEEALEAARENSEEIRNAPDWLHWDAGRLPFPDYSIDKVGTNLPFGEKHGAGEDIPGLYRKVTAEVGRILRPGGKAVFLTSKKRMLQRSFGEKSRLFMERSIEVRILGKRAWVVVAMKK